jgi:hypothetical protein
MSLFKTVGSALLLTAAFALCGCEEEPAKTPSQPKTVQLQTGRFALQKMLLAARLWSGDAQPVQMNSSTNSASDGHDGKAGFWRAVFASASRRKAEPFSWDSASGVDHGVEDIYNPGNRSMQVWDLNFLKVDTDAAFAVAQEHGGKALLEKDPKLPVIYQLDFDSGQLRWHVIYGGDISQAKLTVVVDASTGKFLHKD